MNKINKQHACRFLFVLLAAAVGCTFPSARAGLLETQNNPVSFGTNYWGSAAVWDSLGIPKYALDTASDGTLSRDVSYVSIVHDAFYYYVRIHATQSPTFGGDYNLWLDIDHNPATGQRHWTGNSAIGADRLITGAALIQNIPAWTIAWLNWDQSSWDTNVVERDVVFSISRDSQMPGVTSFDFTYQFWSGPDNATGDWYPDLADSLTGDFFRYNAGTEQALNFGGGTWTAIVQQTPTPAMGGQYNPIQTNSYALVGTNGATITGRFGIDSFLTAPVTLAVGATVEYDFFLTSELRNLSGNNADTWFGSTGAGFRDAFGNWATYRHMRYNDSRDEEYWTAPEGGTAMTPDRYINQSRLADQATHVKWTFTTATNATLTLTLAGDSTPYATWACIVTNGVSSIKSFRVGLNDSEQDVTISNFNVSLPPPPPGLAVEHFWHVGEDSAVLPTDSIGGKPFEAGFGTITASTSVHAPGSTASLHFSGDGGDWMNTGGAINVPADNWVIECWAYPESISGPVSILTLGSDGGATTLGIENGNWAFIELNVAYGNNSVPATTGEWTQLAWVRDNGVNRFFINGVQVGYDTATLVNNGRLHLSVRPGVGDRAIQGYVDEIRFSTFAPGQFRPSDLLFNARHPAVVRADSPLAYWRLDESSGSTANDSIGSNDGTYTGTLTYAAAGAIANDSDAAIEFDGASGYTAVPFASALNPQGPFSIEAWVFPNQIPNSAGTPCPVSSAQFNGNRSGWQIRERDLGWQFVLYNHNSSSVANDGLANASHGGVPSTNSWTHLVGTYDGTTTWLYVNSVGYSSSVSGYVANYDDGVNSAGPFTIGARSSLNNFFGGRVDEVAFYNRALTATEVSSHYTSQPRLTVQKSGANVTLTWPVGTLQQSDAATGTYTDVPTATSPYNLPPTATKKFYRVKL